MLIIDSNYIGHVAKYTTGSLSNDDMTTGVLFGFLLIIKNLYKKFSDNKFVFCWDSKKSYRKNIYPDYKKHRRIDRSEQEILLDKLAFEQFITLRQTILPSLGFRNIFIHTGLEADDLIASFVFKYNGGIIVSCDEDLFQLLDYCSMYNYRTKSIIDKDKFFREYEIVPTQWVKVKAIGGCSSDNVKGIQGVAEKTAIKYILGRLDSKSKVFKRINDSSNVIKLNESLVKLPYQDVDLEMKENDFSIDNFLDICQQYSFNSFLKSDELKVWKRFLSV